jgi:hypothetical protein
MYCTNCGTQLPPGATACPGCGHATPYFAAPPKVPNYLVQSILTTLCCCLPFGIVALVYSTQVNAKLAAGDLTGAQASSNSARTWVIVAFIGGIVSGAGLAALSLWQH